jgi:hypothetical protein
MTWEDRLAADGMRLGRATEWLQVGYFLLFFRFRGSESFL